MVALVYLAGCNGATLIAILTVGLSPLAGIHNPPDMVYKPDNSFDGNITSVGNSASDSSAATVGVPSTVLVRQSDCSVAGEVFTNIALTTSSGYTGTFSGTFTPTATPNYGNTLHSLAGLATKAGVFANGCTDKIAGIAGQPGVLLAKTSGGLYVGAATDINNNLYIGAINPGGTFTATRLSLTNIYLLYVGDVNSEGVRQLIVLGLVPPVAGSSATSVLYTINVHANGTSDAPVTISTPAIESFNVTVDDFNGDGKLDIGLAPATATQTNLPFIVLPGTGNGGFGKGIASVTPVGGNNPILTGDFNGDGIRDVLVGSSILFGKGDGTFTLGPAAPPTGAAVVGDFNNDGKDDLAVIAPDGIGIYLGNGDGTFTASGQTYASIYGAVRLAVTDIDGDGNLDLVVGQGQSGIYGPPQNGQSMTMFLMGSGDGTFHGAFGYANSAGGATHGAFAAGDFNNDGNIDVLTFGKNSQGNTLGIKLLTGNGKGVLTPQPTNTTVVPAFIAAADVNGDGNLDAVTLTATTDNSGNTDVALTVLKGNGDGTFSAPASYPAASAPSNTNSFSNLALGDTRGTGGPDAVLNENGGLYYLKNNGDGTFAAATQIDTQTGFQSLVLVDVNGDGKADIVATAGTLAFGSLTSGQVLVYLSHGDGTFAAPVNVTSVTNGADMIVADMNKDGKPDIVFLSSDPNSGVFSLNVLLGHGDGTFSSSVSSALGGQDLGSLATADVNGDGNPDVLIGACCGNTLASIAYGNGDGTFTTNAGLSIGPSTNAVAFADLNNDGRPDLLMATNQTLVTSLNEFGVASALTKTTTSLSFSPSSPTSGQSITLTATVAPASGTGTPTGTVTFYDGTASLGTGTVNSGVATYTTSSVAAGVHSITAAYSGDSSFATSTSSAVNLTVSALAATMTALTSSAATAASETGVTFTAAVKEISGSATPTGTVTFYDGTTSLGTGTLSSGSATYSSSSLAVGAHSITASYGGDTNNASSTSAAISVTVTPTPLVSTTTLTSSSASIASGSSVTFTAVVTPPSGTSTVPTGTVTFLNGTTSVGTSTLNGTGTATYSTTTLSVGSDSITAQYGGDSVFGASTSATVSVVVGTTAFSLSLSPASISIASGGTGTTTIAATPAFGFASAITFACSGLPAHATCTFSPATVTPSGSAAVTTTLTVATNVASASLRKDLPTSRPNEPTPLLCVVLLGAIGLLRARQHLRNLTGAHAALNLSVLALLLLGMAGAAVIGCGGGSSNSTPAGTSTVTITATGGSQTQTTTLSVAVQ